MSPQSNSTAFAASFFRGSSTANRPGRSGGREFERFLLSGS